MAFKYKLLRTLFKHGKQKETQDEEKYIMRKFKINDLHMAKKYPVSLEPKGSAPYSESSATWLYPVLVQSTSQLPTSLLLSHLSNYLPCMLMSPKHYPPLYQKVQIQQISAAFIWSQNKSNPKTCSDPVLKSNNCNILCKTLFIRFYSLKRQLPRTEEGKTLDTCNITAYIVWIATLHGNFSHNWKRIQHLQTTLNMDSGLLRCYSLVTGKYLPPIVYQLTWHNIQEHLNLQQHCRLNIINCNFLICFLESCWRCAWFHTYLYKIY